MFREHGTHGSAGMMPCRHYDPRPGKPFLRKTIARALAHEGGLLRLSAKAAHVVRREGWRGIARRVRFLEQTSTEPSVEALNHPIDYGAWITRVEPRPASGHWDEAQMQRACAGGPLISILLPAWEPNPEHLNAAVESVLAQTYVNWELCISDDASESAAARECLQKLTDRDPRIKLHLRETRGHISANTNSAGKLASGRIIVLLDQDDVLSPLALFWVAAAFIRDPGIRLAYSDEDKLDDAGHRIDPHFKPRFNYDLLLSQNYVCHLLSMKASLFRELGGLREGLEGAQDHDLVLRAVERLQPDQIAHIPRVLYHWRVHRGSTAADLSVKPYAVEAGRKAIEEHLGRTGAAAEVETQHVHYRVRWHWQKASPPSVTIVIPTRNQRGLLEACINSVLTLTTYPDFRIFVIDNGSDDFDTLEYLRELSNNDRVRVLADGRAFNYSALNNAAVAQADTDLVCLLNNDIEVIDPDWLDEMVGTLSRPDVGIVGAKLLYSNRTVQHAGVITGIGGVAGHGHKHFEENAHGYFNRLLLRHELTAVTGACLLTRRDAWRDVGGLDEALGVAFNDIDYCLRIRDHGLRTVWTPYARLFHHESVSRGFEDTPEKQARFQRETMLMHERWGARLSHDPLYSPNLSIEREDFSLAWDPRLEPFVDVLAELAGDR